MSAKRRQETIARFSVPIESDNSAPSLSQATAPPLSQDTAPPSSQRSRRVHSTQSVVLDGSIDDDADADFVLGDEQEDDDDDFYIYLDPEPQSFFDFFRLPSFLRPTTAPVPTATKVPEVSFTGYSFISTFSFAMASPSPLV